MTGRLKVGQRDPNEQCARCPNKPKTFVARWPEGPICSRCYHQALWRRGPCTGCEVERQLPGLDDGGDGLCADCAGIPIDQYCERCGVEAYLPRRRFCARCVLDDRIDELFPGPSPLEPLIERIRAAESANASLAMLNRDRYAEILGGIHRGELDCTHEMLDQRFGDRRREGNLRELLVVSGLLDERDTRITDFHNTAITKLEDVVHPADRDLLRQFLRWHIIRRLNNHAAAGTLTTAVVTATRQRFRVCTQFARFLGDQNMTLVTAGQPHLDQWLAEGATTRRHVAALITWLRESGHNPNLVMPTGRPYEGDELSQARRLQLLASFYTDTTIPIDVRVAGIFYLLLAMPISRIVTLATTDIVSDDRTHYLRQDSGPIPLPDAFGELIEQQRSDRLHRNTSGHDPTLGWLFPGRRPGRHVAAQTLQDRLRRHGLPRLRPGRHAALAALVEDLPAPIAADVANLSAKTTSRWAATRGINHAGYAARAQ